MDIGDISGLPSDEANESTFESEIDALSKMITDTKDDIHKLANNDEVFKFDSNDIPFTDNEQGDSTKSNKCELLPDDNLAISDILDGSRELDNFISTSNVDSDLQEVLGETFETNEDLNKKSDQLDNQINNESNNGIILPAQSVDMNNVTLINLHDNAQKSQSHSEDKPLPVIGEENNEFLTGAETEIYRESIDKNENSNDDNVADPVLTDYLSEFIKTDDSKSVSDEKLGDVKELDLDSNVTTSSDNKCSEQIEFIKKSDVVVNSQKNLKEEPSIETEEQKESEFENLRIPAIENVNCPKETDIYEIHTDTSIVQQETDAVKDKQVCEPEKIQTLEQIEISEANKSCLSEDIAQDCQLIDEPKVIDKIPTDKQIEKEETIENNDLKHCQNNLIETVDLQNFKENKDENNVVSECNTIISDSEILKDIEIADSELKNINLECLENDSMTGTNCGIADKIEIANEAKADHIVKGEFKNADHQGSLESSVSFNVEQNSSDTRIVFGEPSNSNIEVEDTVISKEIESKDSQNNGVGMDEEPVSTENENQIDIKLSLEREDSSSLIAQDLPEDISTLSGPLRDSITNPISTEVKEMSEANRMPDITEEMIGTSSSSEQDLDSQGLISNILNEVEKDINSDLNKLLETKESMNEDISNFDNSEILNSSDQNLQSLEEKSQDSLSMLDPIPDQIENEKLTHAERTEDIIFEDSSQSPAPLQSDKFINDLYNSCMPDDTTQLSNTEMDNIKESGALENSKSASEIEERRSQETDAPRVENIKGSSDLERSKAPSESEDQQPLETGASEMEIIKESADSENSKSTSEIEGRQTLETDATKVEDIKESSDVEQSKPTVEVENQQSLETDTLGMENMKESTDLENCKPAMETEDRQLMATDTLENAPELGLGESQTKKAIEPSAEISELESAVKFLQESEQTTDSTQVASANEDNSRIFVSVEDSECDNALELVSSDLPEVTLDPIAISEAEIISEAAKLENERREQLELEKLKSASKETSDAQDVDEPNLSTLSGDDVSQIPLSVNTRLASTFLPKSGILDERYKEPPKIEIPETSKLVELPKSALLIQKQRLDSPDGQTSGDAKICDTPTKKDYGDKQQPECENVGSPRIILKIAKSAIAECTEPRSPKSPKVRSSDSPNPEDSPSSQKLGKIKLKLSKGGHPSIIPSGDSHQEDTWHADCTSSSLSPTGMKIKITKSADASEEPQKLEEAKEKVAHKVDDLKKPESPIGMKIKLSKSGDASIIQQDNKETTQESTTGKKQDSPSLGMKIKLSKSGDASIIQQDKLEYMEEDGARRTESPIGMKIKLSKSGDASVISNDPPESSKESIDDPVKRIDSPIGVKIKLAKNKGGSASIISAENIDEIAESSTAKAGIGMKIKLSKSGDASVVHPTQDDVHETTEQHIGMKIKLSKTGDPSIIPSGFSKEYEDIAHRTKHSRHKDHGAVSQRSKDDSHLEMKIKLSKTGHPTIITPPESGPSSVETSIVSATASQGDHADIISFKKSHSDVTIEPIKCQSIENPMLDLHNKRKEVTVAPVESKKPKIDTNTKQPMPDIIIQPVAAKKEHQQSQKLVLESNTGSISRQQMSVINQEISITQVRSQTAGEHLKQALHVSTEGSTPSSSDCEIIEAQPELIIVNENSNSSQDVMIIDEVAPVKTPKKRGRPRRNALPAVSAFPRLDPSRDPLSLDQPGMRMQISPQMQLQMQATMLQQVPPQHIVPPSGDPAVRPRRTCRSQKSYAPPKRGRGRGRGKRKNEALDMPAKKPRMEQEFTGMTHVVKPVIALEKLPLESSSNVKNSPELFRALNQPTLNEIAQQSRNVDVFQMSESAKALSECEVIEVPGKNTTMHAVQEGGMEVIEIPSHGRVPSLHLSSDAQMAQTPMLDSMSRQPGQAIVVKVTGDDVGKQQSEIAAERLESGKESIQSDQNWLAPSIKKVSGDAPARSEIISSLTVIDEETRMSAESSSRSQTPARNMSAPGAVDTLVNEESQNSVLSTATTESEKVKQPKNRRMEISFDPDEGPFTVEKIAEYEWPAADKINEPKPAGSRGETFMIQEQISQYLGVKSFKRKYPDLKRRMVDMEERNFLRENALVSESMCDMGLTAVSSSEVLDIMCSDFPEQYEQYRKHMREKAAKEHSKKQKELSAAANAERNRIDLAEMAMQSAISWNAGFNKARQDSRRYSLDLQTFTVHMPRRPPRYDPARRGPNYPCALISGQYTDYYREYKPAELRYYPLNTVVYGPTKPNERKFDSQSEGSQSDSDSDSSSDDSCSTSSEGTQDTEGSQSTMDEVDMELALDPSIKCKMCSNHLNKNNRPETLIVCGTCNGNVHPSCIDLTLDMVPHIRAYAWQCTDCKTCAQCHDPADEDKMLFCDMCDRGYHIYCVGLRRVPQGRWHCQECAVCANCGSKEPGGANSDRNSVAQWQHEFKKGDKNTRVYVSTFCVPCSKMRGNQGNDN